MLAVHTSITSYISLTVCSVHCLWLSKERKWMASLLSLRMKLCCFGILCWSSQELRSKLNWQADRSRLGHTWACLSGMPGWGLKQHHADLWPFYQCFYAAIGPQSQMCRLLQRPQACTPALLLSPFFNSQKESVTSKKNFKKVSLVLHHLTTVCRWKTFF